MEKTISYYINKMVQKGFPKYDFELLGKSGVYERTLRKSWNAIMLQDEAIRYTKECGIDLTTLSKYEIENIAVSYVESCIEPQLNVEEGSEWYDETYDIWRDVFKSAGEEAYLELFEDDFENFVLKTS